MSAIEELIAREETAAASARERMDRRDRRQSDPLDLAALNVALGRAEVLREALARVAQELEDHASGNGERSCWDLAERYGAA